MSSSCIPVTQNGVQINQIGGPEVLQYKSDMPVPNPAEGELLVKNHLASVNYIDTYFRTGLYPSPKPEILGREGVSTVVALGPGPNPYNFAVGDRVIWLNKGSYCQFSSISAAKAVKLPEGIADEDALAAFLSGLTVLTLLKETYPVQKGDWVLLHAAAGGAGILMTQILKKIGARVIGTAGGPEKVNLVKSFGTDVVIDYKSEEGKNWVKKVKDVTNGEGVEVVYDSVGKDTWEGSLEAVKSKGTVVWFGNSSGPVPPFQIQRLMAKNIKIARPQVFGYIESRADFEYYTTELFRLLKSGDIKTKIYKVYPLEDVARAHDDIESRKTIGKLLLRP